MDNAAPEAAYLDQFTSQKKFTGADAVPDSLQAWIHHYLTLAVTGVRSDAVTEKIILHLQRFHAVFTHAYGHDRISICLRRDVQAWQAALQQADFAPATINNRVSRLDNRSAEVK